MSTTQARFRMLAFAVVALGAVAAIEPYLVARDATWSWTFDRTALALVPGAVAAVGGLAMIAGRGSVRLGGALLASAAALWLMTGPALSVAWPDGALGLANDREATMQTLQWATFFFGLGAIVGVIAGYVIWCTVAPARDSVPPLATTVRARAGRACESRHRPGPRHAERMRHRRSHLGGKHARGGA
jgi:hypothetical protein